MIRPARASNPDSPITVARQCVLRRYQQRHPGRPIRPTNYYNIIIINIRSNENLLI